MLKTRQVYLIYPFPHCLKLGKSLQRRCVNFSCLSWHFKWEKSVFWTLTLQLVRSSLLISAIQRVLHLCSGKLFYKSNRKLFPCVCIAWYKHERGWENSRQLCKPLISSRVCITVSNSPNASRAYVRQCKHGKCFLLLKRNIPPPLRWVMTKWIN